MIIYINKKESFVNTDKCVEYYNDNIKNIIYEPFPNIISTKRVIPLNIFTHWHTKDLKPDMLNAVNMIKDTNPEFTHYLYDNNDCRIFIEKHFEKDVLTAYDCLIPASYKSDLWRYCILYIYGGIYLDIKFVPSNGFKFINLVDKEYFCLDVKDSHAENTYGVYTAIIITKPNNIILKDCINMIVKNVKNKYFGHTSLFPTGPGLLGDTYFNERHMAISDIKLFICHDNNTSRIIYNKHIILEMYSTYRKDQSHDINNPHYSTLWNNRTIYNNCF